MPFMSKISPFADWRLWYGGPYHEAIPTCVQIAGAFGSISISLPTESVGSFGLVADSGVVMDGGGGGGACLVVFLPPHADSTDMSTAISSRVQSLSLKTETGTRSCELHSALGCGAKTTGTMVTTKLTEIQSQMIVRQ